MTRVQFGGDHDAFPLWGELDGYFDVNLPGMRRLLSPQLAQELDTWRRSWATADGGDADDDEALADRLIVEARALAGRVAAELGPEYEVSVRWDDPQR